MSFYRLKAQKFYSSNAIACLYKLKKNQNIKPYPYPLACKHHKFSFCIYFHTCKHNCTRKKQQESEICSEVQFYSNYVFRHLSEGEEIKLLSICTKVWLKHKFNVSLQIESKFNLKQFTHEDNKTKSIMYLCCGIACRHCGGTDFEQT